MWRHPVVRAVAMLVTVASVALLFLPKQIAGPLVKLPLWAQFPIGVLVIVSPLLELLARFFPREPDP